MRDVFYQPDTLTQAHLLDSIDNIKPDRSAEDLLFQVILECGIKLSAPITNEEIAGKPVYFVDGKSLAACFDSHIDENFIKQLADSRPQRAVFRDHAFASDAVKINAVQIFKQRSPTTTLKTL